jgi:hypothetical protein
VCHDKAADGRLIRIAGDVFFYSTEMKPGTRPGAGTAGFRREIRRQSLFICFSKQIGMQEMPVWATVSFRQHKD